MRDPVRSRRDVVTGGVHLAVLSALALAQPVLDILGRNPAFFAVRGSTGTQIVLFAVAITLGVPALLLLVELLVHAVSPRVAYALHLVFVAALAGLLALLVLTKTGALADVAAIAVAAALGVLAAAAYRAAPPARAFKTYARDDALAYDIVEQTADTFAFDVTRCAYAEFYKALGEPELGFLLVCTADFATAEGFGPDVRLTRTQTIMQGASHCDFRYRRDAGGSR